jgi:hypothetical protein
MNCGHLRLYTAAGLPENKFQELPGECLFCQIEKLKALTEWCKPDDDSPPEHWVAFHAVQNCPDCEEYDRIHDSGCRLDPDYDPTPD